MLQEAKPLSGFWRQARQHHQHFNKPRQPTKAPKATSFGCIHAGVVVRYVDGSYHQVPKLWDVHLHGNGHVLWFGALPPHIANCLATGQLTLCLDVNSHHFDLEEVRSNEICHSAWVVEWWVLKLEDLSVGFLEEQE